MLITVTVPYHTSRRFMLSYARGARLGLLQFGCALIPDSSYGGERLLELLVLVSGELVSNTTHEKSY